MKSDNVLRTSPVGDTASARRGRSLKPGQHIVRTTPAISIAGSRGAARPPFRDVLRPDSACRGPDGGRCTNI